MPDSGICSIVGELWNATVVVALLNRSPHRRRATRARPPRHYTMELPQVQGRRPRCAQVLPPPVIPSGPRLWRTGDPSEAEVTRRPPTVNGGGFVVTDQDQRAVFSVDGCGIIGASGQLIVRDGDGNAILFIHKKGGVVQALCVNNWWRGYLTDYGEPSKLVFSLQDPKPVLCMKGDVQVTVEPKGRNRHWDYEVTGSFVQRACAIKNRAGQVAAQIGVKGMMAGRDFYQVVVQPGYDQAFVVGVIAILDNIHGESTRC